MYYSNTQEDELGFDVFIAPDDFDHTAQPVDIYTKFKEWYPIDSKAKYIYYYSDGNYPLTLTPTADEYYKYGYTNTLNQEVIVNLTTAEGARTIWGSAATFGDESGYTKRWVIVYRVSSAKFTVKTDGFKEAIWLYVGNRVDVVTFNNYADIQKVYKLKYIHYANINSFTGETHTTDKMFWGANIQLVGNCNIPETISEIGYGAFYECYLIRTINFPISKHVNIWHGSPSLGGCISSGTKNINFGASLSIFNQDFELLRYINTEQTSVSSQNTAYTSFNYCDIIYTKDKTILYWLAPKTVRGLTIPDQLPQAQIDLLGTKLSTNIMQNYQLYIGTLITDLTNLYLSNKSFSTVEVGVGNTAFMAENNILYNTTKTELIKAGTNNTGSLVIDNAVTTIKANAFLRSVGYTGGLTIPDTVTSIVANSFAGLSGLTGNLVIGNGVTSIVANSFAGVTNLAGSLTIPTTVTTIEAGSISALKNLTGDLIFTGGQWNLSTYSYFGFANFTATSIKSIIDNDKLVNGTVGSPKNFIISKTTYDTLVALSGGQESIDLAASRYINVRGILSDCTLWLDLNGSLADYSINNYIVTPYNNPTFVTGYGSLGLKLNGVNQYLQLPNAAGLNSSFTFSCRAKLDAASTSFGLYSKGSDASNGWGIAINIATNNLIGSIVTTNPSPVGYSTNPQTVTINTSDFNLIVFTFDNVLKIGKLYLNNNLIGSVATGSNLRGTDNVYIGGNRQSGAPIGQFFNGILNDIKMHSRVLSIDEINSL